MKKGRKREWGLTLDSGLTTNFCGLCARARKRDSALSSNLKIPGKKLKSSRKVEEITKLPVSPSTAFCRKKKRRGRNPVAVGERASTRVQREKDPVIKLASGRNRDS